VTQRQAGARRPARTAERRFDFCPNRSSPWRAGLSSVARRGMFEGFANERVSVNGTSINLVRGGSGPPVLFLHGYPQTQGMRYRVAPLLAERFTIVCTDLRGYGDSDVPASMASHEPYSRTMARDQLEVMRRLGFERFTLVDHDRGARVARRLALDRPDNVSRAALLDIVPTKTIYETLDRAHTIRVWRYLFEMRGSGHTCTGVLAGRRSTTRCATWACGWRAREQQLGLSLDRRRTAQARDRRLRDAGAQRAQGSATSWTGACLRLPHRRHRLAAPPVRARPSSAPGSHTKTQRVEISQLL
jgi:pimeloyl-ACP methyl ester carboxylesterase